MVHRATMRQHQDPRERRAALGVESIGVLPDLQEDFLRDFFGPVFIAQNAQRKAVDAWGHRVVEPSEGHSVAATSCCQLTRQEFSERSGIC